MNVLLTNGEYKHSLSIVRSLGKRNIDVHVIAKSRLAIACLSKYCKGRLIITDLNQKNYLSLLINYIERQNISLFIPVGYTSVEFAIKNRENLENHVSVILPDNKYVEIALDKKAAYSLAEELQIPYPDTICPDSIDQVMEISPSLTYPVVIKMTYESISKSIFYINSADELKYRYNRLCSQYNLRGHQLPIIQQYIKGDGYGFFALYDKGSCKRIFMHRRVRELPPSGGASTSAISVFEEPLKKYGQMILNKLQWHGIAMVEFKLDNNSGQFKLMEINPKFWGSLDLAIASGVDFPYYLINLTKENSIEYSENYKIGLKYQWISEDIKYVLERPSSFFKILLDYLNPTIKKDLVFSDIRPFFREIFISIYTLYKKIITKKGYVN